MAAYARKKKRASSKRSRAPKAKKRELKKVLTREPKESRKRDSKPAAKGRKRVRKPAVGGRGAKKTARTSRVAKKTARKTPERKKGSTARKTPAQGKRKKTLTREPKKSSRSRRAKPKKSTAARVGKRRELLKRIDELEKQLEKERQKLRRKKATKKQKAVQKKKVKNISARLEKAARPEPKGTPKEKRETKEDNLVVYREAIKGLIRIAHKKKQILKGQDLRGRSTRSYLGEKRTVRCSILIDAQGVEEILYRIGQTAKKLSGIYPIWQTSFVLAGMGDRLLGYGNRVLKDEHPLAREFQIAYESSGVQKSLVAMLEACRDVLEDLAGEQYTLVYLEQYRVLNYDPTRKPKKRKR